MMILVVGLFVVLLYAYKWQSISRIPLENFNINLYIKNIYNKIYNIIIYNNIIYKNEMEFENARTQDVTQNFPNNHEANFKLTAPDES